MQVSQGARMSFDNISTRCRHVLKSRKLVGQGWLCDHVAARC